MTQAPIQNAYAVVWSAYRGWIAVHIVKETEKRVSCHEQSWGRDQTFEQRESRFLKTTIRVRFPVPQDAFALVLRLDEARNRRQARQAESVAIYDQEVTALLAEARGERGAEAGRAA